MGGTDLTPCPDACVSESRKLMLQVDYVVNKQILEIRAIETSGEGMLYSRNCVPYEQVSKSLSSLQKVVYGFRNFPAASQTHNLAS